MWISERTVMEMVTLTDSWLIGLTKGTHSVLRKKGLKMDGTEITVTLVWIGLEPRY